jgi:hypothetical protein
MKLLDLEKAIERIAYCYSNPANAHLSDTIENYPGLSSWEAYKACSHMVDASYQSKEKWIRYSSMKPIDNLTAQQYLRLLDTFDSVEHQLTLEPNAWMKSFGIVEPDDVKTINNQIVSLIRSNERSVRKEREKRNIPVWSKRELRSQTPTVSGHIPKQRERKIFFLGSTNDIRHQFYLEYVDFVKTCKELFYSWRRGEFTLAWPPQAYIPWCPPTV